MSKSLVSEYTDRWSYLLNDMKMSQWMDVMVYIMLVGFGFRIFKWKNFFKIFLFIKIQSNK